MPSGSPAIKALLAPGSSSKDREEHMTQAEDPLNKSTILGLVAMALAVLVVANDFTALSVALPAMEQDFGADVTTVQWVINGYALVFGVLIVTGGRLADMFGRRRIFFLGASLFVVFSLTGGYAPNVGVLLVCRGLMGVGGAMMWPAILGMTYALLPSSKAGLAGGLILGAAGFGNAIGPLIGGALTDAITWRWIFFLNLPIAAFAIALLSIGLFALLFALDEGIDLGWTDPLIVGLFALATVALVGFVLIERRAGAMALVPNDVLKNRAFLPACMATLLMSAIFFAALLYLPQFMTKVLGYSATASGVGLLPMMGTFALTSFVAGPLYERMGPKLIVSLGAAFLAVGMFMLSMVRATTAYDDLIAGMVVLLGSAFLFVNHHRRSDRSRSIPLESRRRNHLHVPDRRRVHRPGLEYGARRDGRIASGRNPQGVLGGRRARRLRAGGRHALRRWSRR
jgi:MFS family permease